MLSLPSRIVNKPLRCKIRPACSGISRFLRDVHACCGMPSEGGTAVGGKIRSSKFETSSFSRARLPTWARRAREFNPKTTAAVRRAAG